MRVTDNLIANKFSDNFYSAATDMTNKSQQVSSGRKYSKASEDTNSAIKAFKTRRSLARTEQYQRNLNDASDTLDETESVIMGMQELLIQAKENLIQGSTGTMSVEDKNTTATIFSSFKDQVLKLANTSFAGKYILGGTNTTLAPFTIGSDGALLYNGVDINSPDVKSDVIYVDTGLGLSVDASGNADANTAFSISTPGSLVLGTGVDENGISNNIYNLFDEIQTALETNDLSKIELQIQKLTEKSDDILVQVADIGERCKFVEFLSDRADTDKINLKTKQSSLEDVNVAQAITDYTTAQTTYSAALKMGAKVIQTSLLDFLN
ncbi:MAG: hypothetical protein PHV07_04560 [Oscillospiraceae bacterium]|nr:hypothetical protein [Oscillospiraceae bacterium]